MPWCLDELLPILSTTINLSLESGFFPDIWKESVVTPLLKKQGLDLVFKNFRPISNLSFVSKLAERVAADQIQSYLNEYDLFPSLQSAYRRHHSTETALHKSQEWHSDEHGKSEGHVVSASWFKVIPLKLFYYQTFFETWHNQHSWYEH